MVAPIIFSDCNHQKAQSFKAMIGFDWKIPIKSNFSYYKPIKKSDLTIKIPNHFGTWLWFDSNRDCNHDWMPLSGQGNGLNLIRVQRPKQTQKELRVRDIGWGRDDESHDFVVICDSFLKLARWRPACLSASPISALPFLIVIFG